MVDHIRYGDGCIIPILYYEVKAGELLFEIDPADYQTALASAKASVANLEANLLQKQQDLDRETGSSTN